MSEASLVNVDGVEEVVEEVVEVQEVAAPSARDHQQPRYVSECRLEPRFVATAYGSSIACRSESTWRRFTETVHLECAAVNTTGGATATGTPGTPPPSAPPPPRTRPPDGRTQWAVRADRFLIRLGSLPPPPPRRPQRTFSLRPPLPPPLPRGLFLLHFDEECGGAVRCPPRHDTASLPEPHSGPVAVLPPQ
ncbi:hypothetical protein ONE63_004413 [Megalurothrips usitatus]|uniref:Uncharacterized protein n=1 Tax=Megalurothrips usitatus TaxID=439358 RepID=A0AAV7X698_9NEOP|nr:hypothetical protein ONE63_004413 [Megalurothrips usitatus]